MQVASGYELFVSFCNVTRCEGWGDGACLAAIDPDGAVVRQLRIADLPPGTDGVTGVCAYRSGLACILQRKPTNTLCCMDRSFQNREFWDLSLVVRGHSVCSHDDALYIVSSGTDSIVKFVPETGESLFWDCHPSQSMHAVHLNSICRSPNGTFYCTAFGNPGGPENRHRWTDGFVFEVPTGKRLVTGLAHPHSVAQFRNSVLFCHSRHRTVCDTEGNSIQIEGQYTRGLATIEDRVYVGDSGKRRVSISSSSEVERNTAHSRPGAGIATLSWNGGRLPSAEVLGRIDLRDTGREIFDIVTA